MLRQKLIGLMMMIQMMVQTNVDALQCFDCYGTGPDHKECDEQRSCNGVACMIFDAGDNKTASAFCLLAMKGPKIDEAKDGCWLEPDGKGKHCMCFSDFCNKLIDRRNRNEADPMAPLLPTAEFLKQNPLVDYDVPNLGDYVDEGSHPSPKHVLFPSADKQDPRVAGNDDDDDDLVPVDFEDYKDVEEIRRHHHHHQHKSTTTTTTTTTTLKPKAEIEEGVELPEDSDENILNAENSNTRSLENRARQQHPNEISSTTYKPPSWVLLIFPMAASWARFFAAF